MKKRVFIVFLVLLLSVSFVSAAWISTDSGWKWVSGSAVYDPIYRFYDISLSPIPLPSEPAIYDVWTNKPAESYVSGDFGILWVKASLPTEGSPTRVTYSLVSDAITEPSGGWKLLIPYQDMELNTQVYYYTTNLTIPSGLSKDAVSGLRVLVDVQKDTKMVRYVGAFNNLSVIEQPVEPYTKIINGVKIEIIESIYTDNKASRQVTFMAGKIYRHTLSVGASVEVDGKKITLENLGSGGAVLFNVDGVMDTIQGPLPKIVPGGVVGNVTGPISASYAILIINNQKISFAKGDSTTINGKTITLVNIGSSGAILISVDGVLDTISPPPSSKIINGIEIKSDQVFYQAEIKEPVPVNISPACPAVYEPVCATDGINYYTFSNTCEAELKGFKVAYKGECSEKIITPPEPVKLQSGQICNGCLIEAEVMTESTCVPFGTRQKGQFCDISKQFVIQKELGATCENSYECRSNECSDGECISTANLLQKLIDWLSRIFGGK